MCARQTTILDAGWKIYEDPDAAHNPGDSSLHPIGGQDCVQVVDEIFDLGVILCKGLSYVQWHSPDSIIILHACVCVCACLRVCVRGRR